MKKNEIIEYVKDAVIKGKDKESVRGVIGTARFDPLITLANNNLHLENAVNLILNDKYIVNALSEKSENAQILKQSVAHSEKVKLSNEDISLTNLKIKNFRLIDNLLEISFSRNVNIILGKNGFGKSTILQSIALGILPEFDKDTKPIDFEPFITIGQEKSEVEIEWQGFGSRKVEINKINKTIIETGIIPNLPFLGYGTNTFSRFVGHNYDTIVQQIINGTDKWYHTASIFKYFSDEFFDPLGILNKLDDYENTNYAGKKKEIRKVKETILDNLNFLMPIFDIKKDVTAYFFYGKNNKKLVTQQLSEGYQANILLLTDILIRIISLRRELRKHYVDGFKIKDVYKYSKGIIAIDEFDRHLHPTWQKQYIKKLQKVLPNMQFILTTHNPISILDRKEDEVQEVYLNEETIQIEVEKHEGGTKNLDVVLILLKYFDLDSVVSLSLQNKIDDYYERKAIGEKTNDLDRLEKKLQKSLVGIPVSDFRYLRFIEFLQQKGINIRDKETIQGLDFNDSEWDELAKEFSID